MKKSFVFITFFFSFLFFYTSSTCAQNVIVIQPGPDTSQDIWVTNVYSYTGKGGGPGGGVAEERLRVGGWSDTYYSLLQFNLNGITEKTSSATLSLYCYPSVEKVHTAMTLHRNTEAWNWKTMGTGEDRLRLWWADLPDSQFLTSLPIPAEGYWYDIDITSLCNSWLDNSLPNFGIQLRPTNTGNTWNHFYSSRYMDDPSLRPKLTLTFVPEPSTLTLLGGTSIFLLLHKRRYHS